MAQVNDKKIEIEGVIRRGAGREDNPRAAQLACGYGHQLRQRPRRRPRLRPYAFTGTVKEVVFDLKPATTHEHDQAPHEHESIHAVAHGVAA